jgi:hypothetical protein
MDMLDIGADVDFETQVTGIEDRTHEAYAGTKFDNNDEIRITIQNQDSYTWPCESYICIEGTILNSEGKTPIKTKLVNNAFAYLIAECRYYLNNIEIDQTRNVGCTSTLKGYSSFSPDDARSLSTAGWKESDLRAKFHTDGSFSANIPLKIIMGFFEDYKRIIINCKQELVLVRSQNDLNCIVTEMPAAEAALEKCKIQITKINWKMPYIEVSDSTRLQLLKYLQQDKSIMLSFRSWHLCEKPLPSNADRTDWQVQTTTHFERPRYVILAFQTNKRNIGTQNVTKFDHCNIRNVKLFLNEKSFPYDNLNLNFTKKKIDIIYDMYTKFRHSYYGKEPSPLLSYDKFLELSPMFIIDCSKQNEAVKSGSVDVRLAIEAESNFPEGTTAYCILIHDRIVEYTTLTNVVRKHI